MLRSVLLTIVIAVTPTDVLRAQAPALPSFDVATIKAASPPTFGQGRGGPPPLMGMKVTGSTVTFGMVTLTDLVPYAFRMKSYRISGPSWMGESRWDIKAKLPDGESQDRVPEMMQSFLKERFGLQVHSEKREQAVYELQWSNSATKPKEASQKEEISTATSAEGGGFMPPLPFLGGGGLGAGPTSTQTNASGQMVATGGATGPMKVSPSPSGMHLEFTGITMAAFADVIFPFVDRPVVDRTGLDGTYEIALDVSMEVLQSMMQNMARNGGLPPPGAGGPGGGGPGPGRGGRADFPGARGGGPGGGGGFGGGGAVAGGGGPGGTPDGNADGVSGLTILEALKKAGFKLKTSKAAADILVIDRLEKAPTDN